MALTGDPVLLFLGLQTLEELSLVAFLLVTTLLLVEVVLEFGQGPLKGSVFDCVPFMTVFPRAGSKNAVLLFAGSWA